MSALTMSANCASLWPSETHVKSGRLFEIFALLGMAFRSTRELSKIFDSKTLLGTGLRPLKSAGIFWRPLIVMSD